MTSDNSGINSASALIGSLLKRGAKRVTICLKSRPYIGAVALGTGLVAAFGTLITISVRNDPDYVVYKDTMHSCPIVYREGVGLGDRNEMELVDGNLTYKYNDTDDAPLNFKSPSYETMARADLEKITVVQNGKSEHFKPVDAPGLFSAHNRVYRAARLNMIKEYNQKVDERKSYLEDCAESLADRFDPKPEQDTTTKSFGPQP